MDFIQAVKEMQKGKKIRRKCWQDGSKIYKGDFGIIKNMLDEKDESCNGFFSISMFKARDWEVVEESKCVERSMTSKEKVFYDRGFEDGKHWNEPALKKKL